jgi:hypothetical protein
MTEPLLVPPPAFAFKSLPGGFASIEDAVTITFPAVRFADGTAMTVDDYAGAYALLTRAAAPAAPIEVWHAGLKRWRAADDLDPAHVLGFPLVPPLEGDEPWRTVLIGSGQIDAGGAAPIASATGGFPQYRVRGLFRARRGSRQAVGLGPESAPLLFASRAASARFAATLTPDAEHPTRVQLTLRNAAARPVALVELDASGGHPALTLRSFDIVGSPHASITLEADGDIFLSPAAGRRVVITGDLEAERVHYLPASGLPKKTLS